MRKITIYNDVDPKHNFPFDNGNHLAVKLVAQYTATPFSEGGLSGQPLEQRRKYHGTIVVQEPYKFLIWGSAQHARVIVTREGK